MVRNAKNEEWTQLGKELEKDARGNQRKFWARINESRRAKERMAHIHDKNVRYCRRRQRSLGGGKNTLKDCSRKQMRLTRLCQGEG